MAQTLTREQAKSRIDELGRALAAMTELRESASFSSYVDLLKVKLVQIDSNQYSMSGPNELLLAQGRKAGLRDAILLPQQAAEEMRREIQALRAGLEEAKEDVGSYPGGF